MKHFKYSLLCGAVILGGCGGGSGGSESNSSPTFSQSAYSLSVDEDTSGELTVAASDQNNDSLTFSLSNSAANGTVQIDAQTGVATYQPNANFNGSDNFVIAVSDGKSTATANVEVTIAPVNDDPEFSSTTVIVSGGETKQGQISASDIDGDTISYEVTRTAVNGTLNVSATTGEVTYTPNDLTLVSDSFEVTISDGNGGEANAEITLSSATTSNLDRAYYYYASDKSHLKRAEAINAQLTDDESQSIINANIIQGYAKAGLTSEVESRLNSANIVSDAQRAFAMVNVANSYQQGGNVEEAQILRNEANALYTQFVASKGLSAFDSTDVDFFNDLSNSYRLAGDFTSANQAYNILDLLFVSLAEDGYSTSILRTFFGYRDIVEDTIEQWQATNDNTLFDLALVQTKRLQRYAKTIPAQEVTNDRYGNEGEFVYKIRQVALFDVIEAYIELNQLDDAKGAMADLLALHGVVNYDENYPREVDEHWEVTRVEYEYGVSGATVSFVNLYPDAGVDTLLSGLPENSFWRDVIPVDAADALLLAQVRNMEDKAAALQLIKEAKDETDLRNYFTTLVAFNTSNPGAAYVLRKQGEYEAAIAYLQEGLDVLVSDAYFEQEKGYTLNIGSTGCEMLINEAVRVARLSGLDEATAFTETAVQQCAVIAQSRFADGDDTNEDITVGDAIRANAYMLQYANLVSTSDFSDELLANINTNFAKIEGDHAQLAPLKSFVGWQLAKGGNFTAAQQHYNEAIVALNAIEANTISEEVGELTDEFYSYSRREGDYAEFLAILRNAAGSEGYATAFETAKAVWKGVVDTRLAELVDANVLQKAEFIPIYASHLSSIGEFEQALSLTNDSSLGPVEINGIQTEVASTLSVKDDFTAVSIATVDTDFDGMPNFFAPSASEESILASGLVLDDDSDNDGTPDSEDAFPLDPSKQ
ncbi:MAG: hypothetical protein AXW14_08305 [Alteromonas sp. Nap_26]|nr:MAG: hypothetical protein AXW14_08305 [Alteromonas sp. Nap_26]